MDEAEYYLKNYGGRDGCCPPRLINTLRDLEISKILQMIRKPNSIIALLFIQNNS